MNPFLHPSLPLSSHLSNPLTEPRFGAGNVVSIVGKPRGKTPKGWGERSIVFQRGRDRFQVNRQWQSSDPQEILAGAQKLEHLPQKELTEAIRRILSWHTDGGPWQIRYIPYRGNPDQIGLLREAQEHAAKAILQIKNPEDRLELFEELFEAIPGPAFETVVRGMFEHVDAHTQMQRLVGLLCDIALLARHDRHSAFEPMIEALYPHALPSSQRATAYPETNDTPFQTSFTALDCFSRFYRANQAEIDAFLSPEAQQMADIIAPKKKVKAPSGICTLAATVKETVQSAVEFSRLVLGIVSLG